MSNRFETIRDKAVVAENTKRQYVSGLKYWDAWHRLRYGAQLASVEN